MVKVAEKSDLIPSGTVARGECKQAAAQVSKSEVTSIAVIRPNGDLICNLQRIAFDPSTSNAAAQRIVLSPLGVCDLLDTHWLRVFDIERRHVPSIRPSVTNRRVAQVLAFNYS